MNIKFVRLELRHHHFRIEDVFRAAEGYDIHFVFFQAFGAHVLN
jgi:hypothetical protein